MLPALPHQRRVLVHRVQPGRITIGRMTATGTVTIYAVQNISSLWVPEFSHACWAGSLADSLAARGRSAEGQCRVHPRSAAGRRRRRCWAALGGVLWLAAEMGPAFRAAAALGRRFWQVWPGPARHTPEQHILAGLLAERSVGSVARHAPPVGQCPPGPAAGLAALATCVAKRLHSFNERYTGT
jgi:hypothetical protein